MLDLRDDRSENVRYNFADYAAYICQSCLSDFPNHTAVSHWHNEVEFICVVSGHMQYNINGDIVDLCEGEGIFVNACQLHYGFSESRQACEYICVLLHPLLLCSSPHIEQEFVAPILSNRAFAYWALHRRVAWENHILCAIRRMLACLNEPSPQLQIQSLFYQIWRELYNHIPGEAAQPLRYCNQLSTLKDMIGYIQKHYKEKITLDDIAVAGKVCRSSCCTLFHKYLNQTPIGYLLEYRLKKSTELMYRTDMNMTEISFEVGFTGASYFSEVFRKYFGCSPTAFRRKARQPEVHADPAAISQNSAKSREEL